MTEWIQTIDRWLRDTRPDYYALLRPGASPESIEQVEQRLGYRLPEALAQLYMWKDGQPLDCYDSFFYNFMFPPLEAAIGSAEIMNDEFVEGEVPADWWRSAWFPFLDNGGGDMICADMEGTFGGVPGQVVWFMHEVADRDIEYPSVDAWGATFALSLERGLWRLSDSGDYHAIDARDPDAIDALDELRRELFPGYPRAAIAGE